MTQVCDPNTREAEAGASLQVPGNPELQNDTGSQINRMVYKQGSGGGVVEHTCKFYYYKAEAEDFKNNWSYVWNPYLQNSNQSQTINNRTRDHWTWSYRSQRAVGHENWSPKLVVAGC